MAKDRDSDRPRWLLLHARILAMAAVEAAVDCKDEEEREDDSVGRLYGPVRFAEKA